MNSQEDYEQEINIVKERNEELERLNIGSNAENLLLKEERATYVAENEKIRDEVQKLRDESSEVKQKNLNLKNEALIMTSEMAQ